MSNPNAESITSLSDQPDQTGADYLGLVKFLIQPFLESPDSLKVDCEVSPRRARVLIRVAFDGEDKGRIFGRGGRNIQAIRTVIQAIAQVHGYSAHLDVFGSSTASSSGERSSERSSSGPRDSGAPPRSSNKPPPRRPSKPRSPDAQ